MHKLLNLQLRRHFGIQDETELQQVLSVPEGCKRFRMNLEAFLEHVDGAYHQFDRDVSLAHRGLVLSNQELVTLYERQRVILERRERALASLRESARELAGVEPAEQGGDDLEQLSQLVSRLVKEREEAREALVHAQKLESLGALAGGIAHDFNNLLVAISGNLELALMHIETDHPARTNLENMEQAALRSADIVRQLLDYAGKGRLQFVPTDLNTLVQEIEPLVALHALRRVRLEYDLSPGILPIHADPTQVRQALLNLVLNAIESMGGQGGTVTIATESSMLDEAGFSACQVREGEPGPVAILRVTDCGCGMDEATRQKVFDPFFSTKAAGRGLGLAVLHGVLKSHRSAARVSSTPGEGSSFSLFFPLGKVLPEAPPPARESELPTRQARVLVVDDEAPNRGVVGAFLEALGHGFEEASSGQQALEAQQSHSFDALLLDLSMPGMDGAETLRRIRQTDPEVPVILMSGFSEELSRDQLEGLAISGFLQKPFKLKELGDLLGKALHP